MLHEQIKSGIKDALMSKDTVRLDVLRGIVTACTNELVSKGKKPQDMLTDDEVLTVITRLAKQRKDSIEQYEKANRPELVEEEKSQLKVLETFLPKMMSVEEITTLATNKKNESGINDPSKKGMLMSMLMKDLKGKADGSDVKNVVDSLFN